MIYKKLGEYIELIDRRNVNSLNVDLRGLSLNKNFRKSTSNIIGTDLSKYKIMHKNEFAANFMGLGVLVDKVAIVMKTDSAPNIVSSAYPVFKVNKSGLLPEFLFLWFKRSEFDRYCVFKSDSGIRGGFGWEELCEVELPIPSIEKQREIVAQYEAVANKIKVNEAICEKLEATAQALYKQWFVDFEFPNKEGQAYKSSGGAMVFNEELEKEIPEGWEVGKLKDIVYYSDKKVPLRDLTTDNYISTETMLADKKGVDFISNVPEGNNVTAFEKGDILISNIRPYLKKIWFANTNGGCSNDVLCIRSKETVYQFFALNILFNDQFFDYVMQGAKGTKMPRGDKDWILDYKILLPKTEILATFSKDIELVNRVKISKTLQNQKLSQLQSLLLSRLAVGEEVAPY